MKVILNFDNEEQFKEEWVFAAKAAKAVLKKHEETSHEKDILIVFGEGVEGSNQLSPMWYGRITKAGNISVRKISDGEANV